MKKGLFLRCVILISALLVPCAAYAGSTTLTLWHAYRGAELKAIQEVAEKYRASHSGVALNLLPIPYDAYAGKITNAIPVGKGPDAFIYAQDRIGDWARRGIIEPIDFWVTDEVRAEYFPQTMDALIFEESVYGLPLAFKSTTLIYNKKLLAGKKPPKDTDELVRLAKSLTNIPERKYGLVYENGQPFYHSCWMFGFGGGIFGKNGDPILDSPGNVKSLDFLMKITAQEKIIPDEVSNTLVTALFNEEKAAMVISGPWFIGEIDSVDYGLALLPVVSETGRRATPFLSSESMILSAYSEHKMEAFEMMRYFTGPEAAVIRATTGRQPVACKKAYDNPKVGDDPVLAAFRNQLQYTVPMPNVPEMNMVWTPLLNAVSSVINGRKKPAEALREAQKEVKKEIRRFRK